MLIQPLLVDSLAPLAFVTKKVKLENKCGKMISRGLLAGLYSFGLCNRLSLKATEGAVGS